MSKKKFLDFFLFLSVFYFFLNNFQVNCDSLNQECPRNQPILKSTGECVMDFCTKEQYANSECNIANSIVKEQFITEFLYTTEKSLPIFSSMGTNENGDIFFEASSGLPFSTKTHFTYESDGREYIDGILKNVINSGNNFFSTNGDGAAITINSHKCYLKLSANQSIEMSDYDIKKYTFANITEIFGEIKSEKNSLLRTNVANTFIYAYITTDNYLMMQKFKVVSNDASNCIQIIKTLKEDVKSIQKNSRRCMITKNQYVECLDINEEQMYVIRIYNSDLKFLKQYELEKNYATLDKTYNLYHECVWLKGEISIFTYYNSTNENAKPILVLKKLTVKSSQVTLSNLNIYLIRDIVFKTMNYKFSPTENGLAIFNEYYFGVTSLAWEQELGIGPQHLVVALANIFNDDKTIDTHYFDIPLSGLYDINYHSNLRSFGYKNAYGVQMNFVRNNIPSSGFIVFGYANTTDPEPVNNLFDKYTSYTIKVKDYYTGIENNLFCYVFVNLEITQVPSSTYFTVKTASNKVLKKGSKITLNDEITITKVSGRNPPSGRYVLGIAPYLNEADYEGFTSCSVARDMFGQQIPTNWYPDEFYGRTIEFKFTVGIDCFENCLTCVEKGLDINDQKCTGCKNGYYFLDNTHNCFGKIPEGYYFNETKMTYMPCYESCKVCNKYKEGNNHNCIVCKNNYMFYPNSNCYICKHENKYLNYAQTECIDKIPSGYYINDTIYNTINKCYEKCKTCNQEGNDENMNCLSCDNDKGYYLKEGTNNCLKIDEIQEGEYLDNETNVIKKCNIACKTCSSKEIINEYGDVINCEECNIDKGYLPIKGTKICSNIFNHSIIYGNLIPPINELTTNKVEEQTTINILGPISTEIIKQCHPNCLTCDDNISEDENEMNCLTCNNIEGYYMVEGTNICAKLPYPGYYLNNNTILKKCYKDCLTCSQGPTFNEQGEMISMNCEACNELAGLYLINKTKNCEGNDDIYSDICPEDKPILKDGKCLLIYCTEEEFAKNICVITNPVIKNQYVNYIPEIFKYEQPIYSTLGQINDEHLLFQSNLGNPYSSRNFYYIDENARGHYDGSPNKVINLNSSLYSTYSNGALLRINESLIFMKLSNYESLELFDLTKDINTYVRLEDKLGYKVESSRNSLLRTNEENTFIYAYITLGNHLIMTKFKIGSNEAENCMEIIKTNLEEFTTIPKNSRRCMITKNQYIECLDINEEQMYVIRIYNSDLKFLKEYELEKNKAPLERAYYTYHEAIWLKDEIGIFVYYNDISENNAKPNIILKKLETGKNGDVNLKRLEENNNNANNDNIIYLELINVSTFIGKETLFNSMQYILSDTENSLAKINDHYFALATMTSYENNHLLIAIMNIHNNDNSIMVNYFDIPFKDLYNINYYGNLKSFGYKNLFGIQFEHKNKNEYISGFIIFGFGNSVDPEPVDNLFNKYDNYTLKPGDYIKIENNVFCYQLLNVIVDEIPDESSGIIVLKNDQAKTRIKKGDILSINDEIIITYTGNKYEIEKGNYTISFIPYMNEPEYDDYYQCSYDEEHFGEIIPQDWEPDEIYGKKFNFDFTVGQCFPSCSKCRKIGTGIMSQECEECIPNFYLLENSKNCFSPNIPPDGYYFSEKEKIFKKCYKNCKTCDELGTSEYDMKCTSCDNYNAYFFYSGTKNCLKMPMRGYYIDKTDNKIKKCDISCATCSSKAILNSENQVVNCDTCNKDLGFYNIPGTTICINKTREGEYYDESCNCFKKCYKDCLTCSGQAMDEYHMNCLSCDTSEGYEFYPKNSNCLKCKTLNKKVNEEETECIDEIVETKTIITTTGTCHPNCIKCSGPPTVKNGVEIQNCITCQPGLYLKNGNCIKSYTCPYKFFYQAKIDRNADTEQKICLDKNENCPCALPFFYPNTQECVAICPLDMIFYQGCQISDVPNGLNTLINLVKLYFKQGLINTLSQSIVVSELNNIIEEIIVKITLEKLLSKLDMIKNRILDESNNNENTDINGIDLGECENILRKYYNIPDDIELFLLKLDIRKNNSKYSQIQYEIFNPYNRSEKLNLSLCQEQEQKVTLINQIDSSMDSETISKVLETNKIKDKFYSNYNKLFTQYCFKFIAETGADVLIQDRLIDYNYEEILCQTGCKLKGINVETNSASCLCPIKNGIGNININDQIYQEEIVNLQDNIDLNEIKDEYINNDSKEYSNHNFKSLKCINNISSEFAKNYLLIILTVLLFIYLVLGSVFIKCDKPKKSQNKEIKINTEEKYNNKNESESRSGAKSIDKKNIRDIFSSNGHLDTEESDRVNRNDLESMKYMSSLQNDNRTFIGMFFGLLTRNEYILSCFNKKKFGVIFKILRLNFVLMNCIIINTFFISEKNIHKIYLDKNKYNFSYQFKFIILSFAIIFCLLSIIYFIYFKLKKCKISLTKYFYVLSSIFFILFWIYIGAVTSLYINAKRHLLINIAICLLIGFIFEILMTLISTCLRYIAITKRNETLLKISKNVIFYLGNK